MTAVRDLLADWSRYAPLINLVLLVFILGGLITLHRGRS